MKTTTPSRRGDNGGRAGWWFLAVMVLIHLGLALIMPETANRARLVAWHLVKSIAPVLLLVFVLIFLSNLLLQDRWIHRFLGTSSGTRGYMLAALAGIISAGPIYVWYPLLKDMRAKGMKDSLIAVFLYNRAVKLQWLPVLMSYFGLRYTLVLTFWMVVGGMIQGLVVERAFGRPLPQETD